MISTVLVDRDARVCPSTLSAVSASLRSLEEKLFDQRVKTLPTLLRKFVQITPFFQMERKMT